VNDTFRKDAGAEGALAAIIRRFGVWRGGKAKPESGA